MWNWITGRKTAPRPQMAMPSQLKAQWTSRHYAPLVKEGYEKNVIVYRCVAMIARGIATVPWLLYDGDTELMSHPLLDLLRRPSPGESGASFLENLATSFLLSGNAFVHVDIDQHGIPIQLKVLRPDRVRVITENGQLAAYDYTVDGATRRLSAEAVLHLKSIHPLNDWYGLSPIEVAAMAIDQHNAVSTHNLALLQNGGRPSGVFIWKGTDDGWGLTDEQKHSIRDSITQVYSGQGNAGRIMVLEGDVEWKELGLSPKDLDFSEGKHIAAREISQAFGVPPMLVGVPGDATYTNYKEARFHLWEDTTLPLLERFQHAFTQFVAKKYDENLKFSYDVDAIAALAPRREATWRKLSDASFLSENEKRQALGYSPASVTLDPLG
ncbi:phage portal protein [Candidatus Bodocaedibacter vickermanii]|uniref:Phage portal protein n=1 Tax=Candidatus Bodocaedibacter vickermanii TaxID=2741701 RepID=A0A7L9RS62_9PROT|nr:phage portal protein [Candidatus Paracaedibacteraceae bacterium 'Lake Konstanz']